MKKGYRNWAERREIIRAAIADSKPPPLASFNLTESEDVYFRARSARIVDRLARQSSIFKSYYALPTAKPFGYVVGLSAVIVTGAAAAGTYLFLNSHGNSKSYPLLAACATLGVGAVGWAVAGWITHRNAVRQNTNNLLFARFAQAPFVEAMHRFHGEFGYDLSPVTADGVTELRRSDNEDKRKAAVSVTYLLNHYEFIASGVLRGDLDEKIVRDNIRGVVCQYHDKCSSYIRSANQRNPRIYEHLIKLRTHYREP